jgi:hypothetical protein
VDEKKDEDESEKDLADVIRAERQRGRSRAQTSAEARRKRESLLRDLSVLIEAQDREGFEAALREFGYREGTPEFSELMKLWDDVS